MCRSTHLSSSRLLLAAVLLGSGCIPTERVCQVDDLCGPEATDESALQACTDALEDPDNASRNLLHVCRRRANACADGTAEPQWCPEAADGGNAGDAGAAPDGSQIGDGDASCASDCGDGGGDGDSGDGDGDAPGDGDSGVECLSDTDCATGVCDLDDNECVECLADADCDGDTPACLGNACVGCTDSDRHCAGDTPLCDTSDNTCAQCLSDNDCGDPSASLCDAGTCAPCTHNLHCTGVVAGDGTTELGVCDPSGGDGECVQCTGFDYAGCGTCDPSQHECGDGDEFAGDPLVCDSLAKACSDQPEASSGLCGECVSDAECPTGQLCVLQEFDETSIGYFCFAVLEPGNSCDSRPYFGGVADAESIDTTTVDVCTLAVSTCPAHQDFRELDCAPTGTPDDTLCGEPDVSDAYCRARPPPNDSSYRCTVPCGSDDDCRPGFDCNIQADPPHCDL